MTLVILLLLGFGSVLVVSGFEGVSVRQTVSDIWNDNVTIPSLGVTPTTASTGDTMHSGGQTQLPATVSQSQRIVYGSAAGPAQQDAYRQAVVRAYLQARK